MQALPFQDPRAILRCLDGYKIGVAIWKILEILPGAELESGWKILEVQKSELGTQRVPKDLIYPGFAKNLEIRLGPPEPTGAWSPRPMF